MYATYILVTCETTSCGNSSKPTRTVESITKKQE